MTSVPEGGVGVFGGLVEGGVTGGGGGAISIEYKRAFY